MQYETLDTLLIDRMRNSPPPSPYKFSINLNGYGRNNNSSSNKFVRKQIILDLCFVIITIMKQIYKTLHLT